MRAPALLLAGALLAGALASPRPAHAQDADAARAKAQVCAACHGADGNSVSPEIPSLAGQAARYLYVQLRDFKEGRRSNPLMSPMAAPLSREDMLALGAFYAAQTLKPAAFTVDAAKARLGQAKAEETLCSMCHLGGLKGQNEIPRLAGQNYPYVVAQLKAFKARTRTNDAGTMTSVAQTLSEVDIDNLGHYVAGLR